MDTKEVIPADAKEWNEDAELMTWLNRSLGTGFLAHFLEIANNLGEIQ